MDSTKVTCDRNKGNGKLLNKDEKERRGDGGNKTKIFFLDCPQPGPAGTKTGAGGLPAGE
jgi:hypothetical protein